MRPAGTARVIHVITRLIIGGAQENTIATVLGLQTKPEFETELVAGPTLGNEGSLESAYGVRSANDLIIAPSLTRPVRPLLDLKALLELRRIFQSRRPLLVHTHSGKAGILGRWAAAWERVPIIVHGLHGPSFGPWQGAAANMIFRTLEKKAGRVTNHFVSVADAMTQKYLTAGIGRPELYTRIFSGFPLGPFLSAANHPEKRRQLGLSESDLVIGKIARMFKLKGHDDLFGIAPELIKRVPNARFLLIGGGPWENRFKSMARQMGLERHFVFTGLVPPEQIPELTGIVDVLVHLSAREGLPRALPQALAAAKPVVAYDRDGAGEVCVTGQTGFLIPMGDHPALLKALETLARDPVLRMRLGSTGQEYVRERFSVERMVHDTHQLYLRLLAERSLLPDLASK